MRPSKTVQRTVFHGKGDRPKLVLDDMSKKRISHRHLKRRILELLSGNEFESVQKEIGGFPARQVINPLFSFLYHKDEQIKWRAVTAMGGVVSKLADQDIESARVIMRRLLWNLNDESGGIGWGSPEAMGEIMAMHEGLANEYYNMLISYVNPDGNFLEHPMLQRGVLWGVWRLACSRPHLIKDAARLLQPFLHSEDSTAQGIARKALGVLEP